jgi:hypothetical protein
MMTMMMMTMRGGQEQGRDGGRDDNNFNGINVPFILCARMNEAIDRPATT